MFEDLGKAEVGDSLYVKYCEYVIARIIMAEYYGSRDGYYIEFYDTHNQYHYWKQCYDGGRLVKKTK